MCHDAHNHRDKARGCGAHTPEHKHDSRPSPLGYNKYYTDAPEAAGGARTIACTRFKVAAAGALARTSAHRTARNGCCTTGGRRGEGARHDMRGTRTRPGKRETVGWQAQGVEAGARLQE